MRRLTTLFAAVLLAIPAASPAAVVNDEVTSVKLKEADNNGSQDTNSGSGVKTNHIQNKAVTGAKMADGTVSTVQLADGAVTDAKVAGPISASKISSTGLNADTLDGLHASAFSPALHNHDAVYQRRHSSVLVVAKDGTGDFTDPVTALNSIADASASNPYLVKVLPGDFAITSLLSLKPFVDLEGSGVGVTRITWAGGFGSGAAVVLAPDSEVRSLTIAAAGLQSAMVTPSPGATGHATWLRNVTVESGCAETIHSYLPISLTDCGVVVSGVEYAYALVAQADLWVSNSQLDVAGAQAAVGIQFTGGIARVRNTIINATATSQGGVGAGVQVFQGTTRIENSEVIAHGPVAQAAVISSGGGSLYVAHTKVAGQVYTGSAARCLGLYDEQFAPAVCE